MPARLDVHLIVDNHATHKHPKVKEWLAKRPRYHMHFTPTYSSCLNQVERWYGLITQQAIRRGSFESVRQLVQKIQHYVEHNVHKRPFVWTATAESILAKIERLPKKIACLRKRQATSSLHLGTGKRAAPEVSQPRQINWPPSRLCKYQAGMGRQRVNSREHRR